MRLANEEQSIISDTIRQADAEAQIYLFGSRADDAAKGGDYADDMIQRYPE